MDEIYFFARDVYLLPSQPSPPSRPTLPTLLCLLCSAFSSSRPCPADPPSLLDLYVKEEVNVSAGVPTIWLGIQQAIAENPDKWNYKKPMRMIVGGSAAPESMIRAMAKLGQHGM